MTRLEILPTELIFMIFFGFLDQGTWHVLAQVSSWSNFIVKKCFEKIKHIDLEKLPLIRSKQFETLTRGLLSLKKIKINSFYLSYKTLPLLPPSLKHLTLLNSDKFLSKPENFIDSLYHFNQLKTLKIKCLNLTPYPINFSKLSKFLNQIPITSLDLQKVFLIDLTPQSQIILPSTLRSLKLLNSNFLILPCSILSIKIWKLLNGNFMGLNNSTLSSIATSCQNIESLSIIDKTSGSISSAALQNLGQICKKLKTLKLSRRNSEPIKTINDFAAMVLSTQLCNLRYLNLDSFQKLSDAGIIEIISSNPQIIGLSLAYTFITDDSLSVISLLSLEKLCLRNCKRVSSSGLCKLLNNLKFIKVLDLGNTHGVNDEVFEVIEKNCNLIENLVLISPDFSDNYEISLESFKFLSSLTIENTSLNHYDFLNYHKNHNLDFLSLARSEKFTNSDLKFISRNFRSLKKLKLCNCPGIKEDKIIKYLPSLRNLRAIDLRGIKMTARVIWNLPRFRNLQIVKVSELKSIKVPDDVEIKVKSKVLIEANGERKFIRFWVN